MDNTENIATTKKRKIFSYGSNSTIQLRARVQNPNLISIPAYTEGFCRIFTLDSAGWLGGVASLTKAKILNENENEETTTREYGAIVELTEKEITLLDKYEGGYMLSPLSVFLKDKEENYYEEMVEAYMVQNPETIGYNKPTEQYLTAIHVMLREHWNQNDEEITITLRGCNKDKCLEEYETWCHPGIKKLTIAGFCVELNNIRTQNGEKPWIMPKTINEILAKFSKIDILTMDQLIESLVDNSLNSRLFSAGQVKFKATTIDDMKKLLLDTDDAS